MSHLARSSEIRSAALAISLGWICTIIWWLTASPTGMTWGYAVIDICLAAYFYSRAKRKLFPRPLFLINAASVAYYLITTLTDAAHALIAIVVNRLFELSIVYIACCAIFRLINDSTQKTGRV